MSGHENSLVEIDLFYERLKREAKTYAECADHAAAKGEPTYGVWLTAAEDFRQLAADLKPLIDNCMEQYGTQEGER